MIDFSALQFHHQYSINSDQSVIPHKVIVSFYDSLGNIKSNLQFHIIKKPLNIVFIIASLENSHKKDEERAFGEHRGE